MSREHQELMEIALSTAREAGALVLEGWRSRPEIRLKHPKDLVTEFDLRSEELIFELLEKRAPELPRVGEEQGGAADSGLAWFIDPIDGTTNFAHGHPMWCVSIGVLDGERPIAGAVVAPALRSDWTAFTGGPSRRNGERCEVSGISKIEDALVATGFPPDRSRAPENNFETFTRVKQRVGAVRRCGSATLDMCFVGDGTYEAYWERRVHVWDLAAGAAVVSSAGGKLTHLNGGPTQLRKGQVLASNGLVHDALQAIIGESAIPAS